MLKKSLITRGAQTMNNKKYNIRYGVSDIVIDSNVKLPKNIEIYDKEGNLITETEIYYIDTE